MVTKRPTAKKSPAPKRREPKKRASDPTLWADIAAIGRRIPKSELANLPKDGAARFDEYIEDLLR